VQAREQRVPALRAEHRERGAIDVDHADLAHALFDELGMHLEKGLQVHDAALADLV